jgi:hypothetical protein
MDRRDIVIAFCTELWGTLLIVEEPGALEGACALFAHALAEVHDESPAVRAEKIEVLMLRRPAFGELDEAHGMQHHPPVVGKAKPLCMLVQSYLDLDLQLLHERTLLHACHSS